MSPNDEEYALISARRVQAEKYGEASVKILSLDESR